MKTSENIKQNLQKNQNSFAIYSNLIFLVPAYLLFVFIFTILYLEFRGLLSQNFPSFILSFGISGGIIFIISLFIWSYIRIDERGIHIWSRFSMKHLRWDEIKYIRLYIKKEKREAPYPNALYLAVFLSAFNLHLTPFSMSVETNDRKVRTPYQNIRYRKVNKILNYFSQKSNWQGTRYDSIKKILGTIFDTAEWIFHSNEFPKIANQNRENPSIYLQNSEFGVLDPPMSKQYQISLIVGSIMLIVTFGIVFNLLSYIPDNLNSKNLLDSAIVLLVIWIIGTAAIIFGVPELRQSNKYRPDFLTTGIRI